MTDVYEPVVCRVCSSAYPDLAADFARSGCENENGPHTPQAVVLATVLAAAINGYATDDLRISGLLDDALNVIGYLGHADRWQCAQDPADSERWLINDVPFQVVYGQGGEGPGDLRPIVPARTCPACEESVGWAFWQEVGEQVQIECKGCGQDLLVDRWWPMTAPHPTSDVLAQGSRTPSGSEDSAAYPPTSAGDVGPS